MTLKNKSKTIFQRNLLCYKLKRNLIGKINLVKLSKFKWFIRGVFQSQ